MKINRRGLLSGLVAAFALWKAGPSPVTAKPEPDPLRVPDPEPEWNGLPDLDHPTWMTVERLPDMRDGTPRWAYIGNFKAGSALIEEHGSERLVFRGASPLGNGCIKAIGFVSSLYNIGIREVYGPLRDCEYIQMVSCDAAAQADVK